MEETVTLRFPCAPGAIDAHRHFFGAFNHMETEISAAYLVMLAQKRGDWSPFTRDDIEAVYRSCGHHGGFTFNGLTDNRLIIPISNEQFCFTPEFVARCYEASPKEADHASRH